MSNQLGRVARYWRHGTVYTRERDQYLQKFKSWEERPIWFDVWTKQPPFRDPILMERNCS